MANTYYTKGAPIARFTTADATRINQEFSAIAAGFDKLPSTSELNQGSRAYSTATGAANVYAVTVPFPVTSYAAGLNLKALFPVANTGPTTIAINTLPPIQIRRFDGTPLLSGDIRANSINELTSDGTNFRLTSVHGSAELSATTAATAAAASALASSGSATQAASSALSASGSASAAAASASAATNAFDGARFGFKNLLLNSLFWVNQRTSLVFSGTYPAGTFIRDRWKAGPAGVTYSISAGQITITAGSIQQVVAARNLPFTSTYTLSWIGTSPATVNGAPVTNGGQVNLTGFINATISFGIGTMYLPQFEWSPEKSKYELRSTDVEVMLCEQYFQKSYTVDSNPGTPTQNGAVIVWSISPQYFSNGYVTLRTKMRAAPTITLYSTLSGLPGIINRDINNETSGTVEVIGDSGFFVRATAANLVTSIFHRFHWTASAEL